MRKMDAKMQSLIAKVPTWLSTIGLKDYDHQQEERLPGGGIRDLITDIDALKLRVQQAVESDQEKDEWDAGFEERQKAARWKRINLEK